VILNCNATALLFKIVSRSLFIARVLDTIFKASPLFHLINTHLALKITRTDE